MTIQSKVHIPDLSSHLIGADNIDSFLRSITKRDIEPEIIIIDLFCGAGGTSTGFEMTGGRALVIACVNHDKNAIKSHWANYPYVAHFEEDIRTLDLTYLAQLAEFYRAMYPKAKLVLHASLECTNFSKAKGGQPRDADSRTLADHLERYIQCLHPDYITIENVVEFMSWGPLDENGKPVSRRNGIDFMKWCSMVNSYGYRVEWKELNSADYGAYTSRNRLFGIFAKDGLPISWPAATHVKRNKKATPTTQASFFDSQELKPWKAVKDVLDFTDEGKSIFDRSKPLSDKTLERIYAGLIKYVAGGKYAFLLKYNSTDSNGKHTPPSVDEPCPTVACQNRLGVTFITKFFSGRPEGKVLSVEGPAGTITTAGTQAVVNASFISSYYGNGDNTTSVDDSSPTIRTQNCQAVVNTSFLSVYHGNGDNVHSIDGPAPTIPTKDSQALVMLVSHYGNGGVLDKEQPLGALMTKDKVSMVQPFIMSNYSNGDNTSSVDTVAGTITTNPKHNVITAVPFIMHTNYSNEPSSVEEVHPTITANRKWSYIINPSHGGNCSSVDDACPVIVARQDKAPLSICVPVTTNNYQVAIRLDEGDSEIMRKIKEFMCLYNIVDIKMRMLKILELLKIQGFPADYVLIGNQSEQKKYIGNSVVPAIMKYMALELCNALKNVGV